jgi:hypothetical protein
LHIKKEQEEEIEKLREFLEDNAVSLVLTPEDENYIDYDESKIVVHTGQSHEHIVYTILHEIGHYFSDFAVDSYSHAAVVVEEVLAWELGKDIAHTIGLDFDEDDYNRLMIDSIGKYIKYPNI